MRLPLATIDVRVSQPISEPPQTASPVIVLNGTQLYDTWVYPGELDRLIAFLPDHELIRDRNIVEVVWLGRESVAPVRPSLIFSSEDIED